MLETLNKCIQVLKDLIFLLKFFGTDKKPKNESTKSQLALCGVYEKQQTYFSFQCIFYSHLRSLNFIQLLHSQYLISKLLMFFQPVLMTWKSNQQLKMRNYDCNDFSMMQQNKRFGLTTVKSSYFKSLTIIKHLDLLKIKLKNCKQRACMYIRHMHT